MIKLVKFFVRSAQTIRYSRSIVIAVFLAGIFGGAFNTAAVILLNYAIAHRTRSLGAMAAFAGICVSMVICKYLSQVWLMRFGARTVADLRVVLSRQVLSSPLRHLEEIGAHRVLAAITEDIPTIMAALTQAPNLSINVVIVIGSLIYMGWLSWKLLLIVLACIAAGVAGYHFLEQRARRSYRSAQLEGNLLFQGFQALVNGAKELQMSRTRRDDFLVKGIAERARMVAEHRIAGTTNYVVAESWGELSIFLLLGFVVFGQFGGASTQVLTGYVLLFFYLMTPLQFILNVVPTISQADVAVERIENMRMALDERRMEPVQEPALASTGWKHLELRSVTHTYRNEKDNQVFQLGPINLELNPGEILFVTGGNGSGKTTLIKLLTGLYTPESGDVVLNGKAVTDADRENLRHQFSTVFSDFFLFNELYGMRDVDSSANSQLALLQLDHKVRIENGVFSTIELSQGQRKRLALLVAYLEDRPIYVFDEWAADQDPTFRDVFYLDLLPELKRRGKAVVVISHDDRYYDVGDRIIKLDFGKLVKDERVAERSLRGGAPVARLG